MSGLMSNSAKCPSRCMARYDTDQPGSFDLGDHGLCFQGHMVVDLDHHAPLPNSSTGPNCGSQDTPMITSTPSPTISCTDTPVIRACGAIGFAASNPSPIMG